MGKNLDKEEVVVTWANHYRMLSEKKEYAAFIYSMKEDGQKKYYFGRTYSGFGRNRLFQPNVIIPFVYFYFVESSIQWFKRRAKVAGFIHTHPKPEDGFTYCHFSSVDLKLLRLRKIRTVCVAPYENSEINCISLPIR